MVRKIDELVKAKPDVIVMTGNTFAVQKALAAAVKKNPALAAVPPLKIWLSIIFRSTLIRVLSSTRLFSGSGPTHCRTES